MFNTTKKTISNDRLDSILGKNTSFEGTIRAEGTLRVDGNVTGELIIAGNLMVGEGSTIKGNIKADNAQIAGTVEGNIFAGSQLHMTSTAKVLGDIIVKNVIIDEGAVFIGNCKSVAGNAQKEDASSKTAAESKPAKELALNEEQKSKK